MRDLVAAPKYPVVVDDRENFQALVGAMRAQGVEVEVVELTAVREGDRLLVSAVDEDGGLRSASVIDGCEARSLADLLEDG